MLCQFLFINSLQLPYPLRSPDVPSLLRPERFFHYWQNVSIFWCTREISRNVWRYSLQLILITTDFLSEVQGCSGDKFQAAWSIFDTFWGYQPQSGLWPADSCSVSELAVTIFEGYIEHHQLRVWEFTQRWGPSRYTKLIKPRADEVITTQTSVIATCVQQACCLSYCAVSPCDPGRAQQKLHTYSYIHGHPHGTECHKTVAQRDRRAAEAFPRPSASLLV